jgi:mono/diheme cytochrome c family protein
MKKVIYASVFIAGALIACKGTKETTKTTTKSTLVCASAPLSYAADLKSIIETNCSGCHNENEKAGYNFLTLASVKKAGSNGYLLGSIKHMDGYDAMPARADKLAQATIDKIECWISTGMKD